MFRKKAVKYIGIIISFILVVVTLLVCGVNSSYAFAVESTCSDVLKDLEKDSTFSESDYPVNSSDSSLSVIQVAESDEGELLIYVYNPHANSAYNATYIRLSTTLGDSYSPRDYSLTLLDTSVSGALQKYSVDDFSVSSLAVRYYDIVCIFRRFISGVDEDIETETKNNITQVAFKVAKIYQLATIDGEVVYSCQETQVVTIESKYGFCVRYRNGFKFGGLLVLSTSYTLSYCIAFSTDWDIDELYEVDIQYTEQSWAHYVGSNEYATQSWDYYEYGDEVRADPVTIMSDDVGENDVSHTWFSSDKYAWKRIQSASDYLAEVEDNEGTLLGSYDTSYIEENEWVVAFTENEYTYSALANGYSENGTKIYDITLLRFKFKTDGKVYNLGVVDNWQDPNNDPIISIGDDDWLKRLLRLALIVLLIVLVIIFFPWIGSAVVWVLKMILTVLWWIIKAIFRVITLPFRGIAALFKRRNKKE